MKAIILNSGEGKRLRPFTLENPKCMAVLNGTTILELQLSALESLGVTHIIITVGPFPEKIKNVVAKKFPKLSVTYVANEKYSSTNYIYSMWRATEQCDDDMVMLHGDMVFTKKILNKLLTAPFANGVLVNNKIPPPAKDFKAEIPDGRVTKIGVGLEGKDVYFLAPIYKFSKIDFGLWLAEIDNWIQSGKVSVYAEDCLNTILDTIALRPVYFSEELCFEVDDERDLAKARSLFGNYK